MQAFAAAFYHSMAWRRCRNAYMKSAGGLCELCLGKGLVEPGVIVHHKIELTPDNIHDPNITLNPDNLQLVCRDCHAAIHRGGERRYQVDELGRVLL